MKKILNYTSDTPVEKTLSDIQKELVRARANSIRTDYDDQGAIVAIYFQINVEGKGLPFRLPAKVKEAYRIMYEGKQQEWKYKEQRMEQARRTAWRIVYTWLKAQIALIELEQAKAEEIFLPYLVVGKNQTLFEQMRDNQFLLPSGE